MFGTSRITECAEEIPEIIALIPKWKNDAERMLESHRITWFSKLAETTFEYKGKKYSILPGDVWEEMSDALFELIQRCITDDLKALGAVNIRNWGFLD